MTGREGKEVECSLEKDVHFGSDSPADVLVDDRYNLCACQRMAHQQSAELTVLAFGHLLPEGQSDAPGCATAGPTVPSSARIASKNRSLADSSAGRTVIDRNKGTPRRKVARAVSIDCRFELTAVRSTAAFADYSALTVNRMLECATPFVRIVVLSRYRTQSRQVRDVDKPWRAPWRRRSDWHVDLAGGQVMKRQDVTVIEFQKERGHLLGCGVADELQVRQVPFLHEDYVPPVFRVAAFLWP